MIRRVLVSGSEALHRAIPALEYEELSNNLARVWICVTFDGQEYKNVHLSGPKDDVKAYFDGGLTMKEVLARWQMPQNRTTSTKIL